MSDADDAASSSELRRTRERLAEEVAKLQWDLGGLTYEMAIRDHFRPDVLMHRAASLQERDAELAEVERLLHAHETSVAGSCGRCGAVRSRGAVFCWQCGAQLMERVEGDGEAAGTDAAGIEAAGADVGGTDVAGPDLADDGLIAADVHAEINRLAERAPGEGDLGRPVQTGP